MYYVEEGNWLIFSHRSLHICPLNRQDLSLFLTPGYPLFADISSERCNFIMYLRDSKSLNSPQVLQKASLQKLLASSSCSCVCISPGYSLHTWHTPGPVVFSGSWLCVLFRNKRNSSTCGTNSLVVFLSAIFRNWGSCLWYRNEND